MQKELLKAVLGSVEPITKGDDILCTDTSFSYIVKNADLLQFRTLRDRRAALVVMKDKLSSGEIFKIVKNNIGYSLQEIDSSLPAVEYVYRSVK